MPNVYAPEMLPEVTTPRVLVMEWVEGVRLRSAGDSNTQVGAQEKNCCWLCGTAGVESCSSPCTLQLA
jgi:hypothetical protein